MTVYFDHNVQFPGSAATLSGITHDLMCWHKSFPILAVSSKNEKNNTDGSVHFFLDEVREGGDLNSFGRCLHCGGQQG